MPTDMTEIERELRNSDAVRRHTKDRGNNVTTRWMAVAQELFSENKNLHAFNAHGAERLAFLKAESKRHHDAFCAETLRTSELRKENAKLRNAIDEAHTLGLAAKVMLRKGGGEYLARGNLANALAVYDAAQQRAINRSVT